MSGATMMLIGKGGAAFSVSLSRYLLSSGGKPPSHTTASVTAIPANGSGAYTFAWAILESDGGSIAINSPASAATSFALTALDIDATFTATAEVTVTDTGTGLTAKAQVLITHFRSSGPGVPPDPF